MLLMVSIRRIYISGNYESLDLSPLRFSLAEPAECAERYEWSVAGISMVMVRWTGSKWKPKLCCPLLFLQDWFNIELWVTKDLKCRCCHLSGRCKDKTVVHIASEEH